MQTLKVSRHLEKQKRGVEGQPDQGILLTFTEDRALTAIQTLLAERGYQADATCSMTPEARQRWAYKGPVPVLAFTKKEFKRVYVQRLQEDGSPPYTQAEGDQAISALQSLAKKSFVIKIPASGSLIETRLLDVQQLKPSEGQTQHLRVALAPIVFDGVLEGTPHKYVRKPRWLHSLLDAHLPPSGTRSPQLLRLAVWVCCLFQQKNQASSALTENLAWVVGSIEAGGGTLPKLAKRLEEHFELLQKAGLVESFSVPSNPKQPKAKWEVKRAALM